MALTELVATAFGFGSLTQMIGAALAPEYGIYAKTIDDLNFNPLGLQEGEQVFVPSSWIKHEVIAESSISNAPTESGNYTSFNKVRRPAELRVVWTIEGWFAFNGDMEIPFSRANLSRSKMIETLEKMRLSAYTYNITTPDKTYSGYDLTHYDYQVSSNNGVTLLIVSAFFQQINQTLESSVSSSSSDSGTTTTQSGTSSVTLDEAQSVNSNIVQSTDSWDVALARVAVDPVSNLRSAVTTVGTAYSELSQTNIGHTLKNVVTGIGLRVM